MASLIWLIVWLARGMQNLEWFGYVERLGGGAARVHHLRPVQRA